MTATTRLDFRQTDPEGDWFPWETCDPKEDDALDLAVRLVLETYDIVIGDEAIGITITAWDGSQIEYSLVPDAN